MSEEKLPPFDQVENLLETSGDYTVELDDFDDDSDPKGLGDVFGPSTLDNHFGVLYRNLHAMCNAGIAFSDVSIDGDGKDCEAIFWLNDHGWVILKVR